MKKIEIWFLGKYKCPIEIFFLYGKIFIFAEVDGADWWVCKKDADYNTVFDDIIFTYVRENINEFNKITFKSTFGNDINQFEVTLEPDTIENGLSRILEIFNSQKSKWFASLTQEDLVPYINVKWNMWGKEGFEDTDFHIYPWPINLNTIAAEEHGSYDFIFYMIGDEEQASQGLFVLSQENFLDDLNGEIEGTIFYEGAPSQLQINISLDEITESGAIISTPQEIQLECKMPYDKTYFHENFTIDDQKCFSERSGIKNPTEFDASSKEFNMYLTFLEEQTYSWIKESLIEIFPIYWKNYISLISDSDRNDIQFKDFDIT